MQQSRLKPPELVCSLSSSSSAALRENLPIERRRRRDQAEGEAGTSTRSKILLTLQRLGG